MGVATAGYCVGNLHLEGHPLGGEDPSWTYPPSLAPPLQVGECAMHHGQWGQKRELKIVLLSRLVFPLQVVSSALWQPLRGQQ